MKIAAESKSLTLVGSLLGEFVGEFVGWQKVVDLVSIKVHSVRCIPPWLTCFVGAFVGRGAVGLPVGGGVGCLNWNTMCKVRHLI